MAVMSLKGFLNKDYKMITNEMKERMFEDHWMPDSRLLEDKDYLRHYNFGMSEARKHFRAALDLILPLLEKSMKANCFYADWKTYTSSRHPYFEQYFAEVKNDHSIIRITETDGDEFMLPFAGATARTALAEIEREIKKWSIGVAK